MAGEKQIIYYSTIHLTRREDILVQSIISLYRSKDGFEWVHSDLQESAVVVIGTAVNSLLKLDKDPFEGIEKEQVVCILGDIFYPKNARAVIHIDLPIKALLFVDQLADIERSYINKPLSMGYVAANVLARQAALKARMDAPLGVLQTQNNMQEQGPTLNKNGMIDFVPRNIKVGIEKTVAANDVAEDTKELDASSVQFKMPTSNNFLRNEAVKQDSFSFNLEAGLSQAKSLAQESIAFKPNIADASEQTSNHVMSFKSAVIEQEPVKTAEVIPALVRSDVSDQTPLKVDIVEQALSNPTLPVQESFKPTLIEPEPVKVVEVTPEFVKPEVSEPMPLNADVLEQKMVNADVSEPAHLKSDILAVDTSATIVKEPPILTEAIIDDSAWEALLNNKAKGGLTDKLDTTSNTATSDMNQETTHELTAEFEPALIESKVAESVEPVATMQEEVTKPTGTPTSSVTQQSKRIKLLRWPKSEIIQRHPGNAILASMVINIPMSVDDMAKQSDLPVQICQRFMDAVIDANVAEYIDDLPNEVNTPPVENTEQVTKKVEEVTKRKGILYRIRAALGLLRK